MMLTRQYWDIAFVETEKLEEKKMVGLLLLLLLHHDHPVHRSLSPWRCRVRR